MPTNIEAKALAYELRLLTQQIDLWRKGLKWSWMRFSLETGVSRGRIHEYQRAAKGLGTRNDKNMTRGPSIAVIIRIAKAMDITVAELMYGDPDNRNVLAVRGTNEVTHYRRSGGTLTGRFASSSYAIENGE